MIGTKLYKNNQDDMTRYTEIVIWCNENNTTIEDKGDYYEVVKQPEPTLDELKADKLAALKAERDNKEVAPIENNGYLYDYDDKARDRINAAIIALELAGAEASLEWTCADNTDATVTAADLKNIIAAVAVRSNALHVAYRTAKTAVEAAQSKEELEAIVLEK